MQKPKINYFIDFLMGLSFLLVSITGLILFFIKRASAEYLGIQRKNIILIHDWLGILLIFLVILHLILHWNWIKCMTKVFLKIK